MTYYAILIEYPDDPSDIIGPFMTKEWAEAYVSGLESDGISRNQVRSVRIVEMKTAVK